MNLAPAPEFTRVQCSDCPIRHRAVCSRCDDDEIARLDAIKSYRSFRAGEVVVLEGDDLDFAASVVTGCATLSRSMEDGRKQMVGLLLPSDFIGRPGRGHAPYEVTAATDLTLCLFRRKPFESLLVEIPHVGERLLEMALDELDAAREWMLVLGRKSAREKVASLLLVILRRSTIDGKAATQLPLTREAMADYLGLTIETVSRQMSALKKEGLIELQGARGISCASLADLAVEAGEDSDGGFLG